MYYLGISALYHDSAAAIVDENGTIIAAAQEERFTRKKQDNSIPLHAINDCLRTAGTTMPRVHKVVYYEKPMLTLDRTIRMSQASARPSEYPEELLRRALETRIWIHEHLRRKYGALGQNDELTVVKHHVSHAASAYYPSPFTDAAILTFDGVGEWNTSTVGVGERSELRILKKIDFPHSLGLLYSAFTGFCGFRVNSGEYKLMGLAPYGKPEYYNTILENLIDVKNDGSYRLNLDFFSFFNDYQMVTERFRQLFGGGPRAAEAALTEREANIAASIQKVTNEIVIKSARYAKQLTGKQNLVMAGGIALNCTANGELLRSGIFDRIWIQPAAGDAGGALGCAMLLSEKENGWKRRAGAKDRMQASLLGPEYTSIEIRQCLDRLGAKYRSYDEPAICRETAKMLDEGKVVGWFQGRMEFGPRALGSRSILADPRNARMQAKLNLKIKFRESFRPFAPAVLVEDAQDYFEMDRESPYMLITFPVVKERRREPGAAGTADMLSIVNQIRSDIPAVTHVDYSARVQTVRAADNPLFYRLLKEFKTRTGCSCVINTSFNVRSEPIVCSPQDAVRCFFATDMDALVIGNYCLMKDEQPLALKNGDWSIVYDPD